MPVPELEIIKGIPGYKVILKAVIKSQIQQLVDQLSDSTGEESLILTASVSDGSLVHLGSESGNVFLQDNEQIKSQFLGFCLKRHAQSIQNVQQREENYPPADLRQGSNQIFSSEDLQPLSNQEVPSYLHSIVPEVLVEQIPPQLPLQFDDVQFNPASQFSINSVPVGHEHHVKHHGNSHRGSFKQTSGKRGRKKRLSCGTGLPCGQVASSVNAPSETEPAKLIKIEAPDIEMDLVVNTVVEKSKGIHENLRERPVSSSHASTLRALLNGEDMPVKSASSMLSFSQVSNNNGDKSNSVYFEDGNNNDIGVSSVAGDESYISDNNISTTGNVLGLSNNTNTAKGGFRIVVHDGTEDVKKNLKTTVKEEALSESEMDLERSGDTFQSNGMVRSLSDNISWTDDFGKSEIAQDDRKFNTESGNAQDNDDGPITSTQETQTPLTDLSNPPEFGHGIILKGKKWRKTENEKTSETKSTGQPISGQDRVISKSNWGSRSRNKHETNSLKDELPQVLREETEKFGPKRSRKGPQICEFCGLWCKSLAHYKIHLRVHTGLKPYSCQHCKKKFSREINCRLHELRHFSPANMKRHQWRVSDNGKDGGDSTNVPQMMPQQGTGPHQCNVCDLKCQSYALYKVHFRTHTGEKPYKCNFCDASFAKNHNRKVHEQKHNIKG